MKRLSFVLVAVLVPMLAQAQTPSGWSEPPLVPAPDQTAPGNAPPAPPPLDVPTGTPAPPTNRPNAQPYLPYGPQQPKEAPGPEVGLMVSESLFGMLTAAGILVLPFFLFGFSSGGGLVAGDPVVGTVIAALLFGSTPIAVAQTQVSIANGSRHYTSEVWPAVLAGLAAQAAVIGLTYLTGGGAIIRNGNTCPAPPGSGGSSSGSVPSGCGNDVLLLVGSIAAVPLIQMAVINIFKQPRFKNSLASRDAKTGELSFGVPTPSPILGPTRNGFAVGAQVSLIDLRF